MRPWQFHIKTATHAIFLRIRPDFRRRHRPTGVSPPPIWAVTDCPGRLPPQAQFRRCDAAEPSGPTSLRRHGDYTPRARTRTRTSRARAKEGAGARRRSPAPRHQSSPIRSQRTPAHITGLRREHCRRAIAGHDRRAVEPKIAMIARRLISTARTIDVPHAPSASWPGVSGPPIAVLSWNRWPGLAGPSR